VLLFALTALALVLSWLLTIAVRRYAIKAQLMDHPNSRSSHETPTPRGGGLAIVASFLPLVLTLAVSGHLRSELCFALIGSGLLVAGLGFLDDRSPLPARWRFMGHAASAAWFLYWAMPLPPVPMFGHSLELGAATSALAALYIVWSINFFNFMDGIDGLAGMEAVFIALGGSFIWWLVQPGGDWPAAVIFAACVIGFLFWNLPPARIFMGDAGSGFLGLVLAVLALWSARHTPHIVWCWVILSGCFLVDATTTLIRRVRRGERFNEAHRNHAYQYAARRYGSHRTVTLTVLAINVFWLLPVAVAVALKLLDGMAGVVAALAPLIWLAFHYRAGDRAGQERHP
jgi:Fuc2NAc and GlcNAc transferase